MQPLRKLTAIAVPIRGENVDTDQILPARFLPKPRADGFGQYLFHDLRFDERGIESSDFSLSQPEFSGASIIVGETNFGCGSSRENAVWAISDYGIRAVLAPSFGDIFYSNSIKNGVLPVVLSKAVVVQIIDELLAAPGQEITVDLEEQTVIFLNKVHPFAVDEFSRQCLISGTDELDYTLSHLDAIDAFAGARAHEEGWSPPIPRHATALQGRSKA